MDLEHVAIHEAAHAVVATVLGLRVEHVNIRPAEAGGGRCVLKQAVAATGAPGLAAVVAGDIAEATSRAGAPTPRPRPGAAWYRSELATRRLRANGRPLASTLAQHMAEPARSDAAFCRGQAPHVVEWARREARRILTGHWPAVYAVADALLEHGALSGDAVRGLIRSTGVRLAGDLRRARAARATALYEIRQLEKAARGPRG